MLRAPPAPSAQQQVPNTSTTARCAPLAHRPTPWAAAGPPRAQCVPRVKATTTRSPRRRADRPLGRRPRQPSGPLQGRRRFQHRTQPQNDQLRTQPTIRQLHVLRENSKSSAIPIVRCKPHSTYQRSTKTPTVPQAPAFWRQKCWQILGQLCLSA